MELKNLKISLDVWTYRFKLPLKFFLELFWFKQQFDKVKKKKSTTQNKKMLSSHLSLTQYNRYLTLTAFMKSNSVKSSFP